MQVTINNLHKNKSLEWESESQQIINTTNLESIKKPPPKKAILLMKINTAVRIHLSKILMAYVMTTSSVQFSHSVVSNYLQPHGL